MSPTVCLLANTSYYPKGGTHRLVYLNWILGLGSLGCRVIWLKGIEAAPTPGAAASPARQAGGEPGRLRAG